MDRAEVHSSTFEQNVLAMVAGLATLSVIEDERLVARAESTGEALMGRLQQLVERYELFHSVRGKGLMIGLVFGEPSSRRLRAEFRALEFVRTGLFAQLVVGPLFTRHRVLTQVAADKMNVVKILPPLVCGEEEIDWFVSALDDVLREVHEHPTSALRLGLRLAKGALSRAG
jgi:ornithine--oxo-acid transaminase